MLFSRKKKPEVDSADQSGSRPGVFGRLRNALSRTRSAISDSVADLLGSGRQIDENLLEEIEYVLLGADLGVDVSDRLIEGLKKRLKRKQLADAQAVFSALREDMLELLAPVSAPFELPEPTADTYSILICGVNGAGKTTTIGKLARRFQGAGRSVVLAAGDTFRAAAIEQLQAWGERNGIPVVAQHPGADSASVVFDALESARARQVDILIADTAGRLHTQSGLMQELEKVSRVMGKLDPDAPHERWLVIDAVTGQNALVQAREFAQAVALTGVIVTKLDGTAKGGILLAIALELALPIRFIGVGEGLEDLRPFDPEEFVDALLAR